MTLCHPVLSQLVHLPYFGPSARCHPKLHSFRCSCPLEGHQRFVLKCSSMDLLWDATLDAKDGLLVMHT